MIRVNKSEWKTWPGAVVRLTSNAQKTQAETPKDKEIPWKTQFLWEDNIKTDPKYGEVWI
jgi:hypothetical protein